MKADTLWPLDERGWLAGQPRDFQAWMLENGRWRTYAAGKLIYDFGDVPDGLYGLGSGALELTLPLVGGEPVTLYRAEPGFWLGESALLARAPRAIALAAATEARVFRVPAARITALLAERPSAWQHFYELSHLNAELAATLLAEVLALTPRARLARILLRHADEDGRVLARQEELARLLGITRSSLQRALASLTQSGAISSGYGSLVVHDRAALEALRDEA